MAKQYFSWTEALFDWNTTEPQYDYVWEDVVLRVKKCLTWSEADYYWDNNDFDWDNFCIWVDADIPEPTPSVSTSSGGITDVQQKFDNWQKKNEQKKKQIIKLLCEIPELNYKYEKELHKKNSKIDVRDIKLLTTKKDVTLTVEN